jgi:DNA-binding transcriptional MerR regulator
MNQKKPLSIGEVAKIIGVEIHTIRFWTDEFAEYVKFSIGKGERRYYEETAINMFLKIKTLIHVDGIRIKAIKEKKLLLASENVISNTDIQKQIKHALKLLKDAKLLLA